MPAEHPFADRWNGSTRHYPLIAELIRDHPLVLDVSCGDGTLARYLARQGHQVVGIGADPAALPTDGEGTHFMLGDVTGLPFAADCFDAVVSVMVLHRTHLDLALVEMRRVLKPGGLLVDLGTARDQGVADLLRSTAEVPGELLGRRATTAWQPDPQVAPRLGWDETRNAITRVAPGAGFRRLSGRRYLATWRRPLPGGR